KDQQRHYQRDAPQPRDPLGCGFDCNRLRIREWCHEIVSSVVMLLLARITLNIRGTQNSVANVAPLSPPMTDRASRASCSPPTPQPSAMGRMPMIRARAIIQMARSRVQPASTAACNAVRLSSMRSLAIVANSIELAVATPRLMMGPVIEGGLNVVCVRDSAQT